MQPFEEPHLRVISLLWPEYLGYYIMGILNDKGSWGEFIESNISFQCSVQTSVMSQLLQRELIPKKWDKLSYVYVL